MPGILEAVSINIVCGNKQLAVIYFGPIYEFFPDNLLKLDSPNSGSLFYNRKVVTFHPRSL